MSGENMSPFRSVDSVAMAKDLNHDIFKAMVRSYAVFSRLANTEKAFHNEREKTKKLLTELEIAKDNVAIAKAEKEEIIRHERKIMEENKSLKTECASLCKELEREKSKCADAEVRVGELSDELQSVEENAMANFKKTDDYLALLMPTFSEGFNHAKDKFSDAFPDVDISQIHPGKNAAEGGESGAGAQEEEEGEEGDVVVGEPEEGPREAVQSAEQATRPTEEATLEPNKGAPNEVAIVGEVEEP